MTVYVIDGGCTPDHPEFTPGQVTTKALPSSPFDPAGIDEKGHGTHVAGTIGGWRTGVAPGVTLSCIRVLSAKGSGKKSDVAAGWEAVAAAKVANPAVPTVLHASLSGSGTHHDAAMERLAAVGVVPVVSAGNTGEDACERTPARSPYAITVANSDVDDTLWRSSSRGSCVNMIARTWSRHAFLFSLFGDEGVCSFRGCAEAVAVGGPPRAQSPNFCVGGTRPWRHGPAQ